MVLLRVVVRALQRVGTQEDLPHLKQIKGKHSEFVKLKDDPRYLNILTRVIRHCDKAIEAIEKRADQGSRPTT